MTSGGSVDPAPGIKVTAVRAQHSSVYACKGPATGKDETLPGGEAIGGTIELEHAFRTNHAGDTAVFGDLKCVGRHYRPDLALVPTGTKFMMGPPDAS